MLRHTYIHLVRIHPDTFTHLRGLGVLQERSQLSNKAGNVVTPCKRVNMRGALGKAFSQDVKIFRGQIDSKARLFWLESLLQMSTVYLYLVSSVEQKRRHFVSKKLLSLPGKINRVPLQYWG